MSATERRATADAGSTVFERLYRLGAHRLEAGGIESLCGEIVEAAMEVMGTELGSMQLFDSDRGGLRLAAWRGFDPAAATFWQWVDLESGCSCGVALRRGERVVVHDVETCDFMAGTPDLEHYRRLGIVGVQTTPVTSRSGALLGMVSTHWRRPLAPNADQLRAIDIFVRQAADLIELLQANADLGELEERQGFLLALNDALRPLGEPVEIEGEACRRLAERLDVDRAYFVEVDETAGIARVGRDYVRDGAPSLKGEHRLADFAWSIAILRRGECHVVADTQTSEVVPEAERAASAALQIVACVGAPLIKRGRLIGALCVTASQPRVWSEGDVELIREVGERIWPAVERARSEQALAESEEKFRSVFETIDDGFALVELVDDEESGLDAVFRDVNGSFERQSGLSDVVGKSVRELMPNVEQRWMEIYSRVVETGEPERTENVVEDLDRWFRVHFSRVGAPGSRLVAVVFEDITERKGAALELRQRDERHAFLLSLSDAIREQADEEAIGALVTRLVAEHLQADRCWIAVLRRAQNWAKAGPEYRRAGLEPIAGEYRLSDFPSAMQRLQTEAFVLPDVAADPSLSDLDKASFAALRMGSVLIAPLRAGERNIVWGLGVSCVAPRTWTPSDVRLLEETAERAWTTIEHARSENLLRAEREERGRLEREFVANAAHELRTPLTAIIAVAEALEGGANDDPAARDRLMPHLLREGRRLQRLSDSLLLLAQADAAAGLPLESVALRELLDGIAGEIGAGDGVTVKVRAAKDLAVTTHSGLLEQIVRNLAENAAKHTDAGRIILGARTRANGTVVSVEDTGSGLAPEAADRAFDRFYRGGDRTADGFGLGLSIARQAAVALGGILELEPARGGGTVARLVLPR